MIFIIFFQHLTLLIMIRVDASGQIYDEEFDLFFGMFYFINFKFYHIPT